MRRNKGYVYFEAATIESQKAQESGQPEMIYFFYDEADMTVGKVIDALDAAAEYCIAYVP